MKYAMRIGYGYDVHAFCDGNRVCIGGVGIPCEYGLQAHSDGDVLLHAVCDALLGAAALGDIGSHFPNGDSRYKDADSKALLKQVCRMLADKNYQVVNVDATVIAETPRLMPFIQKMRQSIAEVISISADCVSVKATTNEAMGFIGRREGIAAHAVALVEQI